MKFNLIFYFEFTAIYFAHFNTISSILNLKAFGFAFKFHLIYFFDQVFDASNYIGSNFDCEHFDSLLVN